MSTRQKKRFMLLPQEHTVMVRQTSKWGQILLLSLVSMGATAFITAWVYRLDEVITVQGKLVPKAGGVEVKSPSSGQLERLLIKGGEYVDKGQRLLQYDIKGIKAAETSFKLQLKIEKERLEDKLKSNERRKETLKKNIELTQMIQERLVPLANSGAISEIQVLKQGNELETQKDELIQLETRSEEINNDSFTRQADIEGKIKQLKSQLDNEYLKAPISGIVFNLTPDNNKYVASNAETLLKIIPKGKLGAEVNVNNQDIGFIRTGQTVKVRVNSFPYTEYGEINGKIISIGADALPPSNVINNYHFPVTIELKRSTLSTREGSIIPLQAGMTITTNLKLRDRRLIELLSDIFVDRGEGLKRLRQP